MESTAPNDGLIAELTGERDRLKREHQKLTADNRRWMRIAGNHPLTGLPNKVFFTTALLPQAIEQTNTGRQALGCLLIGPDNLGEYNQQFGRAGGDQLVKGLAEFLSENVDEDEKLIHLDGSNFVLIVPGADLTHTKRRSLVLRARALNQKFECAGEQVPLTLSIGIVSRVPTPGDEIDVKKIVDEFLRRLSAALDQAKQLGGDRPFEDPETNF